ncbi:diacylglycerol kinase [Algirhabdus cladophorae]|uniref:diacylglycerol kinase n=1 Tax=Algirhabdus cladophorae TaxID=3377108 RepID=UPI003B84AC19
MLRLEWTRLVNRCRFSWQGVRHVWRAEPSFRFWSLINIASATLALALPLSGSERGLILGLGVLVLAAECLNTGIERVVDMFGEDHTALGGQAKDAASAGVALAAVAGGVAWLCVLVW